MAKFEIWKAVFSISCFLLILVVVAFLFVWLKVEEMYFEEMYDSEVGGRYLLRVARTNGVHRRYVRCDFKMLSNV